MRTVALPRQPGLRLVDVLSRRWLVCSALAALVLLFRLPFRAHLLNGWDAVNYALALQQFDIAADQPQPPGDPLYVATGWILNLVVHDPATAYVVISIGASMASAVAFYLLADACFALLDQARPWSDAPAPWSDSASVVSRLDERVAASSRGLALIAALLFASSPLLWYWGEVQSPYTLLALFSTLVAYCCLRALSGRLHWLVAAVLVTGLSGGWRPDIIVFLFPLLVFVAVDGNFSLRQCLFTGVVLAVSVWAWLVPLILASGGPFAFASVMHSQGAAAMQLSGRSALLGVASAAKVAGRFVSWSLWGLGPAALGLAVVRLTRRRVDRRLRGFFAAWLVPAGLFYLIVQLGQSGYLLLLLPGLVLLAVWGVHVELRAVVVDRRQRAAVWAALVTLNSLVFLGLQPLSGPVRPGIVGRFEQGLNDQVLSLTYMNIQQHDTWLRNVVAALDGASPACCVALAVADPNLLRYPQYYLPSYEQYLFLASVTGHAQYQVFSGGQLHLGASPTIIAPKRVTSLVYVGPPVFSGGGGVARQVFVAGASIFVVPLTGPFQFDGYTIVPASQS